jgi:hypothetical protein
MSPSGTKRTNCIAVATLPKMAKAAQNDELKAAFEKHRNETEGQVERLSLGPAHFEGGLLIDLLDDHRGATL